MIFLRCLTATTDHDQRQQPADHGVDDREQHEIILADGTSAIAIGVIERHSRGCRRELLDQTLIWDQRHLRHVLREDEAHHNEHRPHRSLAQAAPLRALPASVTDLDNYRVRRHDRVGGIIQEHTLAA